MQDTPLPGEGFTVGSVPGALFRIRQNANARRKAGHRKQLAKDARYRPEAGSDIAPLDLLLQRLDLVGDALDARIDVEHFAVGLKGVLVVADLLQDQAEAR